MSQEISRSTTPEGHLAIYSEQPSKIDEGKTLIEFRRKKQQQAQSYRATCVNAAWFKVESAFTPDYVQETFAAALQDAIQQAASDILRSYCDEHKEAISIPQDLLSLQSVVSRMQEDQTAQRLNSEQIGGWYDNSMTKQDAITRYKQDEKKVSLLREKYQSLASNNAGILPELAQKMTAYVSEQDAAHPVCKAILRRLERIQKQVIDSDEL